MQHRFLAVHNLRKIFTFRWATKTKREKKEKKIELRDASKRRKNRQMKEKTKHGRRRRKKYTYKFMWHVVNKPGYALYWLCALWHCGRAETMAHTQNAASEKCSCWMFAFLFVLCFGWHFQGGFSSREPRSEIEIKNKQTSERHLPTQMCSGFLCMPCDCSTY